MKYDQLLENAVLIILDQFIKRIAIVAKIIPTLNAPTSGFEARRVVVHNKLEKLKRLAAV
jgi:hypothetical protein